MDRAACSAIQLRDFVSHFGFWITKVPAIFVVAYITAAIVFIPSMKATAVICSRED